jgi:methionine-S-sulfoxide reductase
MNEIAIFGGGCFWCTEAVFKMLKGVYRVTPGYAGGLSKDATYDAVSSGITQHAEVVRIEYDPKMITYVSLMHVFFGSHDPTTLNRQGHDVGSQYRSIIFTTTDSQAHEAQAYIKDLNVSSEQGDPIVTEVKPLDVFFEAEASHKDYFASNPNNRYCELVINPKLAKAQKAFADLLR